MIFRRTTSSPDESLASNLQCEMVLLSSIKAASSALDSGEIKPHMKKLCNADSAAEVMGPVDNGERRIEKKGARSSGSSVSRTSGEVGMRPIPVVKGFYSAPCICLTDLFSSMKPAINSASLFPRPDRRDW